MVSWVCLQGEGTWQVSVKNPLFLFPLLLSLRRRRRKTFPVSNLRFGYQEEELLETAHGDSHRFEKSSVSTLSISLCTQGQSQITHEGKGRICWHSKHLSHQSKQYSRTNLLHMHWQEQNFPSYTTSDAFIWIERHWRRKKSPFFVCLLFYFM